MEHDTPNVAKMLKAYAFRLRELAYATHHHDPKAAEACSFAAAQLERDALDLGKHPVRAHLDA